MWRMRRWRGVQGSIFSDAKFRSAWISRSRSANPSSGDALPLGGNASFSGWQRTYGSSAGGACSIAGGPENDIIYRHGEVLLGTPQGTVASPLITNVYLHYNFDPWADVWRRKVAKGDVVLFPRLQSALFFRADSISCGHLTYRYLPEPRRRSRARSALRTRSPARYSRFARQTISAAIAARRFVHRCVHLVSDIRARLTQLTSVTA
jgi:hypothetical protein